MTQVIVLNGGSSAGKSTIARALQDVLPGLWLTFGTDVLAEALPGRGEAASREATRPGRIPGMALAQAVAVHAGTRYDVAVDTTSCAAADCARRIAEAAACH
jgi:chloramphenicol 3-O-phosphotransferase